VLDGADHFISKREDAAYVADLLAAWAKRWLDGDTAIAEPEAVAGAVIVTSAGEGIFPHLISAHGHRLRADEPVAAGWFQAASPATVQAWVVPHAGHTQGLTTAPRAW